MEKTTTEDPSPLVTIVGWVVVTMFLALVAAVSAPFGAFVGDSQYAIASALHGMLATLGVIVGSVATYLGWRLLTGRIKAFGDFKVLAIISSIVAGAAIFFGNWIYVAYRASGGPREFFLANNAAVHSVFFEFKEFIALFTFPLSVATAFVLWRYGGQVVDNKPLRFWLFLAIMIAWSSLMIAFLLGAGITKLRSV